MAVLEPVRVLNAVDNVLDGPAVNGAVNAICYLPIPIDASGVIATFHWGTLTRSDVFFPPTAVWVVNVKTAFPVEQVLSDGTYSVWFELEDLGGNNHSASVPFDLNVQNSSLTVPTLAKPLLPDDLYHGNVINLERSLLPITITIPAYPGMAPGDHYDLSLRIFETNGTFIKLVSTGSENVTTVGPIEVEIPPDANIFTGYNGVYGYFYYTITKAGSLNQISFTTQVYIDTVAPGD